MSQEEIQIPKGWELKTIKEICTKITDGEHLKPKVVSEGIPFVSAKDLKENGVNFNHVLYVDKYDAEIFRKKCNPEKNDILIGSRGSIGRICLVNTDQIFCLLGSVILLKPLPLIQSKFLLYFLQSPKTKIQIMNASGHSVVKALYLRDIKKLKIQIPPINLQKRIIQKLDDVLGKLEEKNKEIVSLIEKNKERINFFEKNYFRYLILGEIENHPQRKEWALRKLSEVTISHDGKRVPLNKTQRSQIQGNYPYYGASGQVDHINDFKFDGEFLLLAEDGENLNSRKKPIAYIVDGKFWVNNHAHVLEPSKEIMIEYLCYYINGLNIMKFAKQQSTRPKLNKTDMNEIPIPLPSQLLQKQIVKKIKNAEEKFKEQKIQFEIIKQNYESRIRYIDHIRSSILDSAFSGKLTN
jgi:type I restriction enzyme, S subunit